MIGLNNRTPLGVVQCDRCGHIFKNGISFYGIPGVDNYIFSDDVELAGWKTIDGMLMCPLCAYEYEHNKVYTSTMPITGR